MCEGKDNNISCIRSTLAPSYVRACSCCASTCTACASCPVSVRAHRPASTFRTSNTQPASRTQLPSRGSPYPSDALSPACIFSQSVRTTTASDLSPAEGRFRFSPSRFGGAFGAGTPVGVGARVGASFLETIPEWERPSDESCSADASDAALQSSMRVNCGSRRRLSDVSGASTTSRPSRVSDESLEMSALSQARPTPPPKPWSIDAQSCLLSNRGGGRGGAAGASAPAKFW